LIGWLKKYYIIMERPLFELGLAQRALNLRAHFLHFGVLKNMGQPFIREPDLVTKAIRQGFHLTASPTTLIFSAIRP
jgi:hypothetical protein